MAALDQLRSCEADSFRDAFASDAGRLFPPNSGGPESPRVTRPKWRPDERDGGSGRYQYVPGSGARPRALQPGVFRVSQ